MTTTEKMNIELTAEELAIIKEKREKAAAERKERHQRIMADLQEQLIEDEKRFGDQVEAAETFYAKGFDKDPHWELVKKTFTREYNYKTVDGEKKKKVKEYEEAMIHYTPAPANNIFVAIEKQFTYDTRWSTRPRSSGWAMYLKGLDWKQENRAMKNPKTVIKKVDEHFAAALREQQEAQQKDKAVHNFAQQMKNKYPDAKVVIKTEWVRTDYMRHGGREEQRVYVDLSNGIQLGYRVWGDGSFSRVKTMYPKVGDEHKFIAALNAIQF